MGRHSRKNTSGKNQATQKKEKEKKQKFDDAKQATVQDFKHSNKADVSITKSEEHSVKENWDDMDSNDTEIESKQRNVINETHKNVQEIDENTEEGNKPSRKERKKAKQTNNLQDHEMEWEEDKIADEVPSTQPNTETNPTEERIELHSKKSKRNRKTKNKDQDDDRETNCQEIKPDNESNSTEECNAVRSKKSRRRRKPKNNNQDDDREMRCQENKIPSDVPSTPSNNEKKPLEDWNEVHYKNSKKNGKPKNNDQDRDWEMEWQVDKIVDRSVNGNTSSKDKKEHFKKNRDYSSHRRDNSREHSSHQGKESRKKDRDDSSHRKEHSRKHDEYFYQKDRYHSSRQKNEPRQHSHHSKTDDFRDPNFRNKQSENYSRHNLRSDQDCSEDSYHHHQKISRSDYDNGKQYGPTKDSNDYYNNKGYNAGSSKKRSENYSNENSFHKTEVKYEPPHRRQGRTQFSQANDATSTDECPSYDKTNHQNQNFRQNRENNRFDRNISGRAFNDANNSRTSGQFKKKSYKQPLFVPNAQHYEPTIREIEGDLFEASEEYALGHCVAEDLLMGAGIAVEFKKRFKGVNDLWNQDKRTGEVAILQRGQRFIFYIITKVRSNGKPTIGSFKKAIQSLKQNCLELKVKKLAIPRIGCGLDGLDWGEVKDILYDEFNSTGIEIVVYVL